MLPTYVCQITLFRHLNAADIQMMSLADVVLEGDKWHILKHAGLRVDCFKTEYLFLKIRINLRIKPVKRHPCIYFLYCNSFSSLVRIKVSRSPQYGSKVAAQVFYWQHHITSAYSLLSVNFLCAVWCCEAGPKQLLWTLPSKHHLIKHTQK